jgi:tetratricopeptide (TPR) repeat protein
VVTDPRPAADNRFDGRADTVVQAGGIHGPVHIHEARSDRIPVPRQLPMDAAHFTGRSTDLAKLDTRSTCAVITGPAGVGKTALALRWAHSRRDRFPDGDLYVDLHGYDLYTPAPLEQVFERLLRALGVPSDTMPSDVESQAALYRSLMADRKILVVLDNATSTDQLLALLPGSPTCFVLVTSRNRLSPLLIRTGAERVTLDPLPAPDALLLFRAVIGAGRVDREPRAAEELARLCCHLPLALRIVADRAVNHPHRTLAELADELEVERDRLDVLTADGDEATAVRAVFSWSYQALAAAEARVFRLLGLHPGPDLGSAAAAALAGLRVSRVVRLLDGLASVHLLQETGRDRYRCHDLLRVYAAERADAEESEVERTAALRRVLDFYLRTANAADELFNPLRRHVPLEPGGSPLDLASHSAAVAWCEAERTNLLAATRRAAELGHHDIAWRLPIALWGYFTLRTPWVDWVATYRIGLESARVLGDRRAEAWLLGGLGIAYRDLRRFPDALDSYDRAIGVAREVGDRYGEGWTLGSKSVALWELKRFDEALRCSVEALAVFRDLDDRYGEGQALYCFGEACRGLRRYDEAISYFLLSLRLRREINDRGGEAQTTHSLGDAYRDLRRLPEARETYLAALDIWTATGDRWGEARTLVNLGDVLAQLGHADEAQAVWERSLAICDDLGSPKAVEIRARLTAR